MECKFFDQLARIFGDEHVALDSISTETQLMAVDEADGGPSLKNTNTQRGFCPTILKCCTV